MVAQAVEDEIDRLQHELALTKVRTGRVKVCSEEDRSGLVWV